MSAFVLLCLLTAQVDSFGPAPTLGAPSDAPAPAEEFGLDVDDAADALGEAAAVGSQAAAASSGQPPLTIERAGIELKNKAQVSSSQPGVIVSEVPVPGTRVKKGDLLFKLDDDVPQAAVRRASIQADSDIDEQLARKYYDVAKNEYQQQKRANAKVPDTISELEVERSYLTAERSRLDILKAQHEQDIAIAQEDEARALLTAYTVNAPFDGVVKERIKQTGEAVRAGDPVLELVDLETLYVRADVAVQYLARVGPGTVVQVIENYGQQYVPPGPPLTGRVVLIEPEGDVLRNTVRVKIEVENRDRRLIPGLLTNVIVP